MIPEASFSNSNWAEACSKIIAQYQDSDPILILRAPDPEKVQQLRKSVMSLKHAVWVSLGGTINITYLGFELLLKLDPQYASERLSVRRIPHQAVINRIRKAVRKSSLRLTIMIDNLHHLRMRFLFRLIRLINGLEGTCVFVFLIPFDEYELWIDKNKNNPRLKVMLKLLTHCYEIH